MFASPCIGMYTRSCAVVCRIDFPNCGVCVVALVAMSSVSLAPCELQLSRCWAVAGCLLSRCWAAACCRGVGWLFAVKVLVGCWLSRCWPVCACMCMVGCLMYVRVSVHRYVYPFLGGGVPYRLPNCGVCAVGGGSSRDRPSAFGERHASRLRSHATSDTKVPGSLEILSLIHISEPTRPY